MPSPCFARPPQQWGARFCPRRGGVSPPSFLAPLSGFLSLLKERVGVRFFRGYPVANLNGFTLLLWKVRNCGPPDSGVSKADSFVYADVLKQQSEHRQALGFAVK